jgi:hypothetical protein
VNAAIIILSSRSWRVLAHRYAHVMWTELESYLIMTSIMQDPAWRWQLRDVALRLSYHHCAL